MIYIYIYIYIVGFQQQAGLENKADQEKREATKQDESALTEEQAMS
jgi:hypothetical protein